MGQRTTNIDFAYLPLSFSTAEAEISIRTTEFDSQPKLIRIVGSAAPFSGQPTDIAKEELPTKTLLTSTKSYNPNPRNTKLKKIGEKVQEPTQSQTNSALANLKSVKMTAEETNFLVEYRRLEELEREKGIKFF